MHAHKMIMCVLASFGFKPSLMPHHLGRSMLQLSSNSGTAKAVCIPGGNYRELA